MFGKHARLAVTVAVPLFVGFLLGDQWSWHRHGLNKPWESIGWLALVIVSVAIVVALTVKHSRASAPVSVVLGGIAVSWGLHVLKGISWSSLGLMALIVVGFALLYWASHFVIHGSSKKSRRGQTGHGRIRSALRVAFGRNGDDRYGYSHIH